MSHTPETPDKPAVSRRDFMRDAMAVAAGAGLSGAAATRAANATTYKSILPATVLGANERILTGHIGVGGMGRSDLGFVMQRNDMQSIALCDSYSRSLDMASAMLERKFPEFDRHHDFRELLENDDIDAVVIATPDHWHCLMTLYAADAGKDIYCEKPASTTIEEGNKMVEKVREKNVVFQGGNMQRSGEHFQEAVQLVQEGYIGKIARIETWIHDNESIEGIGQGMDADEFQHIDLVDWDLHQGWVEHRPFNTNRFIYNFRWFLDYSGGKITDWGAHLVDIALWAMGEEKQPKKIAAQGGKYIVQDNRTTPDTLEVLWEFDDYVISFGNRVYNSYVPENHHGHGILFHGTLGSLLVSRGGYEVYSVPNNEGVEPKKRGASPMNEPHWENFVQCIRSRQDPISTVEVLNNTSRICHMGTCAYVAGAQLNWDHDSQRFTGSDGRAVRQANDWAYRPYLNGWSLEAPYWRGLT